MYKSQTAKQLAIRMNLPEDYIVTGMLSCGSWDEQKYFERLLIVLDELGIKHSSKILTGFLNHIYELEINGKYYWFTLLYGGAMLSEYTHLACMFGSKKNIHIGTCGGLNTEINTLDFIVPTWSFGNDSVTRAYARDIKDNKHYSDKKLSQSLKDIISLSNKVFEGPIITCQAKFGETWEDVQDWSKEGYFGVEMETSTIFSVSNHFKVPCASLLYVTDNLIKGQIIGDESYMILEERREKTRRAMYKAGLKAIIEYSMDFST
jgi:purine-nucleoside phosphorylase